MSKKQITYFLLAYIALRVFSFFFHPGLIDSIVSAGVLLSAIYFLLKRSEYGWYIVAGEIILGGTESFLEIRGMSLRTLLLICSALIFIGYKIKDKKVRETINANKKITAIICAIYIWLAYSALNGWWSGFTIGNIKAAVIPYLFLFYYYPLVELLRSDKFKNIALNLLAAAIFGNLIFIIFTFIGYSSGLLHLQDSYYHWFRDVANGKITGFDFNFYRIVLNEQLLLIPLLLCFLSPLCHPELVSGSLFKRLSIALSLALIILLSINFTRIYILALPIGLMFLFKPGIKESLYIKFKQFEKWLIYTAAVMAIFFLSFTIIHFAASRGQSLGWEFFGIRLQSIAMPQIEDSSLSRLVLLPAVLDKIKLHPVLGNGLGDSVSISINYLMIEGSKFTPAVNITTTDFDWGYLQMIDNLGLVGFAIWIFFIVYCFSAIYSSQLTNKKALIASLVALLVINVTSPALFHVMGIIWITTVISMTKSSRVSS